MCPVKRGSPRLIPCCLCHNWCHISCSLPDTSGQSALPCPLILRHPCHEDCVALPTRNTTRPDNKNIERDVATRVLRDDTSLSRWRPASWLNLLLEKHAWLSAGLVWMHGASESGIKGVFEDSGPGGLESRPTINLFEQSLGVPYTWMYAPRALSLSEAVNNVSQHEERNTWGQASQISMVAGINYPNQPEPNPGSILSDPLIYWWGVTLCPPMTFHWQRMWLFL